jgi:ankyrin repeat protein
LQRTPLWLAARNGQGAVVAALLQHQANVNSADRLGRTALRLAIQGGHDNVVRTLLDSGAEIESDTDALVSLAASGGTWKLLEERSQAGDEEDAIGLVALFG